MNNKFLSKLLLACCGALALVSIILGIFAVRASYESTENYFSANAPLWVSTLILATLSALVGIVAAVVMPRQESGTSPFPNRYILSPTVAGFACNAIAMIAVVFPNVQVLHVITLLSLALAAVYSALTGSQKSARASTAGFGLFAILACICLTAYYYFDTSVEMNAPIKVAIQFAILFAMIYFTGEIRFLLGTALPRLFLAMSALTVATASIAASITFTAYFTGKFDRIDYLAGAFFVMTIALTAIFRVATLLGTQETKKELHAIPVQNESPDNSTDEN